MALRRAGPEPVRPGHRAQEPLHVVLVQVDLVAPLGRPARHVLLVDVEVQEHVVGAGHLAAQARRPVSLEGDALGKLFVSAGGRRGGVVGGGDGQRQVRSPGGGGEGRQSAGGLGRAGGGLLG